MLKSLLAHLAISTAFFDSGGKDILPSPEIPMAPTGTKPPHPGMLEYFFDASWNYSTERVKIEECVFKCWAINDANAIRKYRKFMSK